INRIAIVGRIIWNGNLCFHTSTNMQRTPGEASFDNLLKKVERFWKPFPDKPEENPEAVLHALWLTAVGMRVSATKATELPLPALNAAALARLHQLLASKQSGVALAHLTGKQNFLGLELLAGPEALIPRKETEILGRAVTAK